MLDKDKFLPGLISHLSSAWFINPLEFQITNQNALDLEHKPRSKTGWNVCQDEGSDQYVFLS